MKGRAWVVVATLAGLLAACTRQPYAYVAFTGDNIAVTETGEPRHSYWRFGGGPIPLRYSVDEAGASLTISVTGSGLPEVIIVSSVPIRFVEATHRGSTRRNSQFQYTVRWSYWPQPYESPVAVGDPVELKVYLEDRTDPVRLTGTVMTSGTLIYSD